jgi:ribosome maturation factor RimP
MELRSIAERIREIAVKAVADSDIELVHVEIAGIKRDQVIRVFIDKAGGVTLDDCSAVSQRIEAVLDAEDLIPSKYVLEVSSPGIERQLYSLADFVKFAGQLAKVKLKTGIEGQKTFIGTILGVDGAAIIFNDHTVGEVKFDYPNVDKANLKIDLAKEFGSKRR